MKVTVTSATVFIGTQISLQRIERDSTAFGYEFVNPGFCFGKAKLQDKEYLPYHVVVEKFDTAINYSAQLD